MTHNKQETQIVRRKAPGRGKEPGMQTFSISGNQWFDQMREPVLLLGEQGLLYYNAAAERLFRSAGVILREGDGLPEALAFLAGERDVAGEAEVAGRRFFASAWNIEAGRLIQLRPVQEEPVFPNDRLSQLAERLRNPMSNLISAAELVAREVTPGARAQTDRYLTVLNQSYYRLLRLVNHIDYARFLPGDEAEEFDPVVLDLAGLCREVGRQVSSLGSPGGLAFSCVDNAGSLLVRGDGDLLAQMLYQLIANAWRSGGHVTLQIDHRRDRAVVTVSDDGHGMSQDALRDAFDPSAGRDGLAAAGDGLGLGIPICQHIAALHGGTMVLESRPEQGVAAIVSLPVCSMAQSVEVHTSRRSYDSTGGFSPLLVELADVLPLEMFQPEHLE